MSHTDTPWADSLRASFAIHCDEEDLTYGQGIERAEQMGEALLDAARERDYARADSDA